MASQNYCLENEQNLIENFYQKLMNEAILRERICICNLMSGKINDNFTEQRIPLKNVPEQSVEKAIIEEKSRNYLERKISSAIKAEQQKINVASEQTSQSSSTNNPLPSIKFPIFGNWNYLCIVKNIGELDKIRCHYGVAKNRNLTYGIRYACTKTIQKRRCCRFMMFCKFLDFQKRENGPMRIYVRGEHWHPLKTVSPKKLKKQQQL